MKKEYTTVRMPEELHWKVRECALKNKIKSVSEMYEVIVNYYLDNKGGKNEKDM